MRWVLMIQYLIFDERRNLLPDDLQWFGMRILTQKFALFGFLKVKGKKMVLGVWTDEFCTKTVTLHYLSCVGVIWAWLQGASVLCWGKSSNHEVGIGMCVTDHKDRLIKAKNITYSSLLHVREGEAYGLEFCSLPNMNCSLPTEKTKMPLRMLHELTHAALKKSINPIQEESTDDHS